MQYANFKIPVRTTDGCELGMLSQVDGPYMRIGRGWWRRDFWVPTEYIAEATAREVIVSFRAEELPRYIAAHRLPAPEPLQAEAPAHPKAA